MEIIEKTKQELTNAIDDAIENGVKKINDTLFEFERKNHVITMQEPEKNQLGLLASYMVKAVDSGKTLREVYSEHSKLVPSFITKGLDTLTSGSGGALSVVLMLDDVVPVLQANNVLRSVGIETWSINRDSLEIPVFTTLGTPAAKTQKSPPTAASPTTSKLTLQSKQILFDVPVSNQFLQGATPSSFQTLQNMIIKAIANKEESLFLTGSGASGEMAGLTELANSSNIFNMTASPTAATRRADMIKALKKLASNNVDMNNVVFVVHSQVYYDLISQVDGTTYQTIDYANELALTGTFKGHKVLVTNNCPTDKVFCLAAPEFVVVDFNDLEIEFIKGGTYYNGSGYVSGNATRESVFYSTKWTDCNIKHDVSVAIIDNVTWGA